MNLGTYVHTAILEPHLLEEECAVYTGKVKRGREWEEFEEKNKGKTIITASQKRVADKMLNVYNSSVVLLGKHPNEKEVKVSSFYTGGVAEETLTTTLDGMPIKVRFDYRKEFDSFGSINDVKTTYADIKWARKEEIEKVCRDWMYDLSAALYVDAVEKVTGKPHDFYFTFLSTSDYGVRIVKASEQFLSEGRRKYKEAIALIQEGERTGEWYSNTIEEIDSI